MMYSIRRWLFRPKVCCYVDSVLIEKHDDGFVFLPYSKRSINVWFDICFSTFCLQFESCALYMYILFTFTPNYNAVFTLLFFLLFSLTKVAFLREITTIVTGYHMKKIISSFIQFC